MESYPLQLISHLSPLVVIQGIDPRCKSLAAETALKDEEDIKDNPLMRDTERLHRKQRYVDDIPLVKDVLKIWMKYHLDGVVWDSNSTKQQMPTHQHRYRLKPVDDDYALPNKTHPSELSPGEEGSIITADWLQKYRCIIPSLFIGMYSIDTDLTDEAEISKKDEDLAMEIHILKDQLMKRNVKLLVILVSEKSVALHPDLEDRVNDIRRITGLNNRNGLLLLSSGTAKELQTFAMEVLQVMKVSSSDYYGNLDKNVRRKKSKTLSTVKSPDQSLKNRIEARYSIKLGVLSEFRQQYEPAVKHYETAYENIVELLNMIQLDNPKWKETRLLLDTTLFHIVRIYFYLEKTNTAYKKFDVHTQTVMYFLKDKSVPANSFAVSCWLSQQFKWLAQLSDLSPTTLVPSDTPYKTDSLNRVSPLVLPHSGYLYLQAVDLLKRRGPKNEEVELDSYATGLVTESYEDSLINLLKFAKLAFQKKDNTFNRSIAYTNFQLGQEYFNNYQFEKAMKFFEQSLDCLKEDEWTHLLAAIHMKLLKCSLHLKKHYSSVLNLLEISLLPESPSMKTALGTAEDFTNDEKDFENLLKSSDESIIINADVDSNLDLFETCVLFKRTTVPLSKNIEFQLRIKSQTNHALRNTKLDDVLVTFEGQIPSLILKHDPNAANNDANVMFDKMDLDEERKCYPVTANLLFQPLEEKTFTFIIPALHIGSSSCTKISGVMSYGELFEVRLLSLPMKQSTLEYRHEWINANGSIDIVPTLDPFTTEVVPRQPDTRVSLVSTPSAVVYGEKVSVDMLIDNEDHENVDMDISAKLLYGENQINHTWNGSLSELKLVSIPKSNDIKNSIKFEVPQYVKEEEIRDIQLRIDIVYYVNHDREVPMRDSLQVIIPIVNPFTIGVSIYPRVREDDLPKTFEIEEGDVAIPKPSRYWLMRLAVVTEPDTGIKVFDDTLHLKSGNEHVLCREIVDNYRQRTKDAGDIESDHYIETVINDGHTYRNIAFEAVLSLKWQREGSDTVNEYIHEKWKLSFPLLDPRVLLDIDANDKNNDLVLTYLIENPTSRIFAFSTTLIENQAFQVSGTKSLSHLSVLPCTRQAIVFHVTPLSTGLLQLPQLKVYDLDYRVNLPTLPITDIARAHKQEVFVQIDDI